MNEYDYSPVELLRLQIATRLTTAFIGHAPKLSKEIVEDIVRDALVATEYLLEGCRQGGLPTKTPQDKKVRVPEGQNIYLIDGYFYYEFTNAEGEKIRTKLGE